MPNPQSKNIDTGTLLQALALAEHGVPRHIITSITSVTSPTIGRYQCQARDKGYNPEISHALLLSYVVDKPQGRRPRKPPLHDEGMKNKSKRRKGLKRKSEDFERREDSAGACEDVIGGDDKKREERIDCDDYGGEGEERMNLDPRSPPPTAATNFVPEHITTQQD